MSEPSTNEINFDEIVNRFIEALIKKVEGGDDPRKKYDYLTKLDQDTVKSLAILSEGQLDSIAECGFLGKEFPSMDPLKTFSEGLAQWSPSKAGKRAEQLTATMISQETHVIPTILNSQLQSDSKKKKDKEGKDKE